MNGIVMVGRNVRRFRQERQLSLGDLAKSAGLAKQTLANLENGTGNPTIETLLAVAEALGLGVTWLLAEWGTPVYVQRAAEAQWDEQAGCRVRTLDRTFGSGQVNTSVFELSGSDGEVLPALPGGALHHVYVIRGAVTAGPAAQEVTLRQGDFIRFPGDVPHLFRATSPTAALHIVTTIPQAQQFSALLAPQERTVHYIGQSSFLTFAPPAGDDAVHWRPAAAKEPHAVSGRRHPPGARVVIAIREMAGQPGRGPLDRPRRRGHRPRAR